MGFIFKLLLTALIILVVWWVVKFRGRMSVLKAAVQAAKRAAQQAANAPTSKVPVVLVACPKCGTYIATGTVCICANEST